MHVPRLHMGEICFRSRFVDIRVWGCIIVRAYTRVADMKREVLSRVVVPIARVLYIGFPREVVEQAWHVRRSNTAQAHLVVNNIMA